MKNTILECDGRDLLDLMFEKMYPNTNLNITIPNRCTRPDAGQSDKILSDIIQQKMQTKALPLAMRKRLLYEQAMCS